MVQDEVERFKPWWQTLAGMTVISLGLVGLCGGFCFLSPLSYIKGDTDIFGNYHFATEIAEERASYSGLELVHAQLFPSWLIATTRSESPEWREQAVERYGELETELDDDELRGILERLRDLVAIDDPGVEEADLFRGILREWNGRVQALGEPYFIRGSLVRSGERSFWVGEYYRELYAAPVQVDSVPVTIRVAERADKTNVVESYLGVAEKGADDALVVVDRILEFAVETLWPLFEDREGDVKDDDRVAAAFRDRVREEASEALGKEHFAALERTAPWRRQLKETIESISSRRNCGHSLRFRDIPWNGYDPRSLDQFAAMARADRLSECERMTFRESDALTEASRALQRDREVQGALEALVSWVTRGVAIHEARHIADDVLYNGLEDELLCDPCGRLGVSARAELSAYAATLAWGESPAAYLLQACMGATGGPHRQALARIVNHLGRRCDVEPSETLGADARKLEEEFFRRTESIELPADYPEQIRIRRFR